MLDQKSLDDLYSLYGFTKQELTDYAVVYTYSEGYFNNAEVVQLTESDQRAEELRDQYSEIGYSVRLISYENLSSAREALFRGFFRIDQSNRKLLQEYETFRELQTKKLSGTFSDFKYSYIQGDYYYDSVKKFDDLIVEVCNYLFSNGPRLIILEAAAGFGKTCTSYEVAKYIVENYSEAVPLLTELSKNRKANIFKYVLLSEMDSKFTKLSYNLVTSEIKSGRVPLIIDGFDEILSKGMDDNLSSTLKDNEDTQSMLDTIADMLKPNSEAKILLTSRKSSIFAGDAFDEWVDKQIPDCNILRIQIAEPSIVNWIGQDKVCALSANGIDITNISNPVLLTILRNTNTEDFGSKFKTINDVLVDYFNLLLSREIERQQLRLSVEEQYKIMTKLAAYFVDFDISSEEASFIKEMLEEITENDISGYLKRYTEEQTYDAESKPSSYDEFLMKLVHHALLDRMVSKTNRIGFINDFIFGLLICNALLSKLLSPSQLNAKFLDIAVTAYSVKTSDEKDIFWKTIELPLKFVSEQQQLNLGLSFLNEITRNYTDQTFDSIVFSKKIKWNKYKFINCIFIACTFDNSALHTSTFSLCQFYDCKFYEIEVIHDTEDARNLIFLGGFGYEKFAQAAEYLPVVEEEKVDYQKIVLQQFWKIGYDKAERRRTMTTLFKGTTTKEKDCIAKAISDLVASQLLEEKARCYELNTGRIAEIKKILGRV